MQTYYTGWKIVQDCDDGSLLIESPGGSRVRIWQAGERIEQLEGEVERLQLRLDEAERELAARIERLSEIDSRFAAILGERAGGCLDERIEDGLSQVEQLRAELAETKQLSSYQTAVEWREKYKAAVAAKVK